jgi:hypothetical protein
LERPVPHLAPVADLVHVEPGAAENVGNEAAHLVVVFGHEDATPSPSFGAHCRASDAADVPPVSLPALLRHGIPCLKSQNDSRGST